MKPPIQIVTEVWQRWKTEIIPAWGAGSYTPNEDQFAAMALEAIERDRSQRAPATPNPVAQGDRPWSEAVPGEIWELGISGGYHCNTAAVIEKDGQLCFFWGVGKGITRSISITDRTIDYGTRLHPTA